MTAPQVQPVDAIAGRRPQPEQRAATGRPPLADQETDVWYGGYSSRALLPSFVFCCLASAGTAVWLATSWQAMPPRESGLVLLAAAGVLGALWLFQIIRWLYRLIALHVRLTTRRLFHHRGLTYPCWKVVCLRAVGGVEVRATWIERVLGVGRVCLFGDDPARPLAVLQGIAAPARLAERIRQQLR